MDGICWLLKEKEKDGKRKGIEGDGDEVDGMGRGEEREGGAKDGVQTKDEWVWVQEG